MKLSIGKPAPPSALSDLAQSSDKELKEIRALYARLRDNPCSDSESVRQTILASMVMLIAQRLYTRK